MIDLVPNGLLIGDKSLIEKGNWRARSQSHVIDYGYEAIDDITLARAEMHCNNHENISDRELSLTTCF